LIESGVFKGEIPGKATKDLEAGAYTILALGSEGMLLLLQKQQQSLFIKTEKEAKERIIKYVNLVGLSEDILDRYPHQLSGGMKQRIIIASALFLEPKLVICDEPTTALDVVVQAQIINLLKKLKEELDLSFVFVTHDLATQAEVADRIQVMYAGKIAEIGTNEQIYGEQGPAHPYTQRLIAATPRINEKVEQLEIIPGTPPDLLDPPKGCRFYERCDVVTDKCELEEPPLKEIEVGHKVACWRCFG
jgi:peptide/nickel transport system ATP-binding protein